MSDDILQPQSSDVEEQGNVKSVKLASRWARLWAAIIDGLIALVFFVPLLWVLDFESLLAETQPPSIGNMLLFLAYGAATYLLCHGYLLHKYGQTIGKNVFDIAIVTMDNQLLGLPKLLLKRSIPVTVLSYIPYIGSFVPLADALFIFRKDRRCIHDLIAGTQVICVAKKKELVLTD